MNIRSALIPSIVAATLALPATADQEQPKQTAKIAGQKSAPAAPRVPMTRFVITAGDVTGDGISESIVYDTDSKAIRVIGYSGPAPVQTMGLQVRDTVVQMTADDLDGDGKAELITGEGLHGYNPKEGPQTDVSIKIYKPSAKGDWSPLEIYRKATERPEVTSLSTVDLDGDGRKELLFAYMASKYVAHLRTATRSADRWTVRELPSIRMGMHVAAGDVLHDGRARIVVGRPYGDPDAPDKTTAIGDAFVLDGEKRIPLPVTRGVSSVAIGDLDGDGRAEIVVGDGWHANYGKLARCRIGIVSRRENGWHYDLIEDLEGHLRFEQIELVDLSGDGKPEVVGRASKPGALGGSVRVYEQTASGWRAMTAAQLVQSHAAGDFNGDKKLELVFAGQPPLPVSLASAAPAWETKLGEAVDAREVDPATLVDKPAPALKATEWLGSDGMTIDALKGRVVLLDFWATWCKPCIEMYPEMRKWVEEFGPRGLVIVGITNHSNQTSAQVKRFFDRQKLPWPVAIDPKNATHVDYGVSPIPHTFLIDREGVVRLSHKGGGDLTPIKRAIEKLLAEKAETSK
ncbi:MAG TPA: FG-GAP-like repeat-containing protein [Thermoanaerobaculia bacterium]|nr:FG-GAP-like repeat-containing protein [Thermoanaerobaculia bacterium]